MIKRNNYIITQSRRDKKTSILTNLLDLPVIKVSCRPDHRRSCGIVTAFLLPALVSVFPLVSSCCVKTAHFARQKLLKYFNQILQIIQTFTSHCSSSSQGRLCKAMKYLGSPQKPFVHFRWDGQSLWLQHFCVSLKRTDFSKSPLEIVDKSLSSYHLSLIPFSAFKMETYTFLRQMPKPMFSLS